MIYSLRVNIPIIPDQIVIESTSSPVLFNEESRNHVLARMRVKYGNGEFFSGNARNVLFKWIKRPSPAQWADFINWSVLNGILIGEIHRGRYRYHFI